MIHRSLLAASCLLGFAFVPGCDLEPTMGSQDQPGISANAAAPRLRLRISGNLEGYLMPCGCASGQLGGLARRVFRHKLDQRNIDLFLEGGNLLKKADELGESKLMAILEILDTSGYHGLGIGPKDLLVNPEMLGGLLSCYPNLPALAADLLLANGQPWLTDAEEGKVGNPLVQVFHEHKLDHVTVRLASLIMELPAGETAKKYKLLEPAQAWQRAMKGVAPATFRVLMVHADREVIKTLELSPKPDLIIGVNHDYLEPKSRADEARGVPLVYAGVHGRVLLDVTLTRGAEGPVLTRMKIVPLKGSITAPTAMRDPDASTIILGHRQSVKEDNLLERFASQFELAKGQSYVGSERCADCHEDASDDCGKHSHSHAWKTLIESEKKEGWPVTHYPECVSCHVVGYGYKSGFISPKKTPNLLNVTCENCHGPGKLHAASDGAVAMAKVEVKTCTDCHNFEHSPKFDYSKYWKMIMHGLDK